VKLIRRPLTPLDKMFQGPALPYSPGSLKKRDAPAPPVLPRDETAREAGAGTENGPPVSKHPETDREAPPPDPK